MAVATQSPGEKIGAAIGRWAIPVLGGLAFLYLLLPIAYIFVFSFNEPARTNLTWRGFTLENWANPCGAPGVCQAVGTSIQIGLIATLISLVLGTLVVFAFDPCNGVTSDSAFWDTCQAL